MHDLFGADQRSDAFGIGYVRAPRVRAHVELPAVGPAVLRFRPGKHAVIADHRRQFRRGFGVLDPGIGAPGGALVPGALSARPPLVDDLADPD